MPIVDRDVRFAKARAGQKLVTAVQFILMMFFNGKLIYFRRELHALHPNVACKQIFRCYNFFYT